MTTSHSDASELPLACEFLIEGELDDHTDELRAWLKAIGSLTIEGLLASDTIQSCDDLFNPQLWGSSVGTGEPSKSTRNWKLTRRVWDRITSSEGLHWLGLVLGPLPHIPGGSGLGDNIMLQTVSYEESEYSSSASYTVPARFLPTQMPPEWCVRLVDTFRTFAAAIDVQTAHLGWMPPEPWSTFPLGTVDWNEKIAAIGWATIVGDRHVEKLGGLAALRSSGVFTVDTMQTSKGDKKYCLQMNGDLFSMDQTKLSEASEVLKPLLPPPPRFP